MVSSVGKKDIAHALSSRYRYGIP